MQAIINVNAVTPWRILRDAVVLIDGRRIIEVAENPYGVDLSQADAVIDGNGMYASPGFVDMHVHGGGGFDTTDGDASEILRICEAHAFHGTTSILPTTMAAPISDLYRAVDAVRQAQSACASSNILGVYLEGPYFSQMQRGAQNPDHIRSPQKEEYLPLLDAWDGIRMMSAAPELEGGMELGRELRKRGVVASIGHSNASYDQVLQALENGYSDITHIYCGCSSVMRHGAYRVAGVVEAGLLRDDATVQVIADGKHLPEALLKLIYRCKGPERISLITDGLSFSACDLKEGSVYEQKNGMKVLLEDGVMMLPNRQSFAGSICTSNRLVYNMTRLGGASLTDAVRMATSTPAKILGIGHHKAALAPGYDADVVLFDEDIRVRFVMVNGNVIRNDLGQ